MIARLWRAVALNQASADAYVRHLTTNVVPVLRTIEGHRGVRVLQRRENTVEILVMTFWDSNDAIRRFAGEDPEHARLPGAVQSHHEQALSPLDVEGDALEDRRSPVPLGQGLGNEHRPAGVRRFGEAEPNPPLPRRRHHLPGLEPGDPRIERLRLSRPLRGLPTHRVG
jgi:heme-degrading monooxygenase HmoA